MAAAGTSFNLRSYLAPPPEPWPSSFETEAQWRVALANAYNSGNMVKYNYLLTLNPASKVASLVPPDVVEAFKASSTPGTKMPPVLRNWVSDAIKAQTGKTYDEYFARSPTAPSIQLPGGQTSVASNVAAAAKNLAGATKPPVPQMIQPYGRPKGFGAFGEKDINW